MENELLISAAGISKNFGPVTAVDDISIDVYSGEIYGVAGLNGAGKSTLLAILAKVMRPDRGAVFYRGEPGQTGYIGSGGERPLRIGYVPQDIALFPDLSVYDNLKFWMLASSAGRRGGYAGKPAAGYIKAVAETAGLSGCLRRAVRTLSGGMRRRVNIAAALVSAPDVLIMDEPTAGLDVKNRRDILNFIATLAMAPKGGLAVVCTSHQSGELEMISNRLLLMDRGKAVFDGPPGSVFSGKYESYDNIDDILYSLGSAESHGV